jgi:hypothetical protein
MAVELHCRWSGEAQMTIVGKKYPITKIELRVSEAAMKVFEVEDLKRGAACYSLSAEEASQLSFHTIYKIGTDYETRQLEGEDDWQEPFESPLEREALVTIAGLPGFSVGQNWDVELKYQGAYVQACFSEVRSPTPFSPGGDITEERLTGERSPLSLERLGGIPLDLVDRQPRVAPEPHREELDGEDIVDQMIDDTVQALQILADAVRVAATEFWGVFST